MYMEESETREASPREQWWSWDFTGGKHLRRILIGLTVLLVQLATVGALILIVTQWRFTLPALAVLILAYSIGFRSEKVQQRSMNPDGTAQ